MTQEQFKSAWQAIETEALTGRMSTSGAMARVTLLALDFARRNGRDAALLSESVRRAYPDVGVTP